MAGGWEVHKGPGDYYKEVEHYKHKLLLDQASLSSPSHKAEGALCRLPTADCSCRLLRLPADHFPGRSPDL